MHVEEWKKRGPVLIGNGNEGNAVCRRGESWRVIEDRYVRPRVDDRKKKSWNWIVGILLDSLKSRSDLDEMGIERVNDQVKNN